MSKGAVTYVEIFSGVLITVVDSNGPAADAHVEADAEVSWLERHAGSVLLDDHLSVQELALGCA